MPQKYIDTSEDRIDVIDVKLVVSYEIVTLEIILNNCFYMMNVNF